MKLIIKKAINPETLLDILEEKFVEQHLQITDAESEVREIIK